MTLRPAPTAPRPRRRLGSVAIATTFAVLLGACIPSVSRGSAATAGPNGSGERPIETIAALPSGPTPIPTFARPTPTPGPTFLVYVVKAGDNLDKIAHRFGTTGRSIAYWNRATYPSLDPEAPGYQPNLLKLGWSLVLIPNVVVDPQTLPEPTPNPTDPGDSPPA